MKKIALLSMLLLLLVGCDTLGQEQRPATDFARANGQFITIDDVRVYYEVLGPRDGTPIIFLHGFGGSSFQWRASLPVLADAGFYAIAYDRPGAGFSDKPFDFNYSSENQAEFLRQLIRTLNIERAAVVGHSQGGRVAAEFAIQYPQLISRLVLVAPAIQGTEQTPVAGLPESATAALRLALSAEPVSSRAGNLLQNFATIDTLRQTLDMSVADPAVLTDDVLNGYLEPFRTENWETGVLGMLRDGETTSLSQERLTVINAPTLILWGTDDMIVPITEAEVLIDVLPNDRLITYDNTGHLPMEEVPVAFNQDILNFIIDLQ